MSSWELVTQLVWFPLTIMQRVSRHFLYLGRTIYGSFFGTRPAIKPAPPKLAKNLQQALPKEKSFCVIEMDGNESSGIQLATTTTSQSTPRRNDLEQLVSDIAGANPTGEITINSDKVSAQVDSITTGTSTSQVFVDDDVIMSENRDKKRLRNEKRQLVTVHKTHRENKHAEERDRSSLCAKQSQSDCPSESKRPKLWTGKEEASSTAASSSISSAVVIPPLESDKKTTKKKRRGKKGKKSEQKEESSSKMGRSGPPPPNFFIAVQITDKTIVDKVMQLQKSLSEKKLSPPWHGLSNTEIFKDAMVPVTKLHFTLHVMHLAGEEDVEIAKSAFMECCRQADKEFKDNPLDLTIAGLGHFKNSVIFAQINDEAQVSRLTRLADIFRRKFNNASISGDPRPFKAHLTIAKISRSNKLHKRKIRSFPPEIWTGCEDTHFGTQRIEGVQFLYMAGEDKLTGYYRSLIQHNFENSIPSTSKTESISTAVDIINDKINKETNG